MNPRPQIVDPAARRLRLARMYFLAVAILVFGVIVAAVVQVVTDESLHRVEVLISNVHVVVVVGIVVPALLLYAGRLLQRRARRGAVMAAIAFVLLVLGIPMIGTGAVIAPVLALIGIAFAASAWRAVTPVATMTGDTRGVEAAERRG